ncbi:MAG: hypothetical protein ABJG47_19300 [Ekhidna sp.]
MKKLIKCAFAIALLSTALYSCETTSSVDEITIEDEKSHGNDAVVRKKPG